MNINKIQKIQEDGLTVLEFIIYFAMTLMMLGVISQIALNIFDGREKIKAYEEVGRSGRNALNVIVDTISDSDEVLGTSGE